MVRRIPVVVAFALVSLGLPSVAIPTAHAADPIVVTTTDDVVDPSDGVLSVREAVDQANATPGTDTVVLVPDAVHTLSRCSSAEGDSEEFDNVDGDLNLTDAAGAVFVGGNAVIAQSCEPARVMMAHAGPLTLSDLTLGPATGQRVSTLAAQDALTLDHAVVRDGVESTGQSTGAAVEVQDGPVLVVDSVIEDNNVTALRTFADVTTIEDSRIANNGRDGLEAGGVDAGWQLQVKRSEIVGNRSLDDPATPVNGWSPGGVTATAVEIVDSTVAQNTGGLGGGVAGISVVVSSSTIAGNHARVAGGLYGDHFEVDDSMLIGNSAVVMGGGAAGEGSIRRSTVANNSALDAEGSNPRGRGGGIMGFGRLEVHSSTVTGNEARGGAGVFLTESALPADELDVVASTISGNHLVEPTEQPTTAEVVLDRDHHTDGPFDGSVRFERSVVGTPGSPACSLNGASRLVDPSHSGYSFFSDSSCLSVAVATDLLDGGDPRLGPLQDNGGLTETRVPVAGSPVRDRIPMDHAGCGGTDQRGVARPQGLGCDIGAVEVEVAPAGFVAVAPVRILDTRVPQVPAGWPVGLRLSAGGVARLPVTGVAGVPAEASAVVLNVTSTEATSALGYVTAWPAGQAQPLTSILNLQPGANVANSITVAPGVGGAIDLFTNVGSTHLIVDVLGYYVPVGGDGFTGVDPVRVLDTRFGPVPASRPVGQKVVGPDLISLPVAGPSGVVVPADASAVVVNITSTQVSSDLAFVTAWPHGQPKPLASNLNLQPAYNVSNLALVKVGDGGMIDLFTNTGSTHLIVDVMGYFSPSSGDRFLPVNPARLLDTRSSPPLAGSVRHAQVADVAGVPADATAVVVNATSTQASSAGGFLTLFAKGTPTPSPLTSNLNYRPPFNAPNQAITRVGTEHSVTLLNGFGTAHIILDTSGYFVDSD